MYLQQQNRRLMAAIPHKVVFLLQSELRLSIILHFNSSETLRVIYAKILTHDIRINIMKKLTT